MGNIIIFSDFRDVEISRGLKVRLEVDGHKISDLYTDLARPIAKSFEGRILDKIKENDIFIAIITKDISPSAMSVISLAVGYSSNSEGRPKIFPVVFEGAEIPSLLSALQTLEGSSVNLHETANQISQSISLYLGESKAMEDEKKATIARVEATAESYIDKSLKRLEAKEKNYRTIAYICYSLCGVSLIGAIIFLLFKADFLINSKKELTTFEQIQSGVVGFLLLALIISISRYLFLIGKSFMVESLRNSDRIHAISFGEFYLKAFPDKAEWNYIKEAFQHWNIDGGSSFITQSATDFDPEIIKNFIEFTKVITPKK